eukprot:m.14593 g.14593  ORF g.14593 m.14593 type:complete len:61 (+) comp4804_c0_seq1:169-351(+)
MPLTIVSLLYLRCCGLELLQSDGNCPDGRFLVRPSGGNHILTVGFKVSIAGDCELDEMLF